MISNKKLFKYISIGLGVVAVPSVAVAGFFVIGNADKFRQFSVSPVDDSINGLVTAYRSAVFNGAELIMAPGFTHKAPIVTSVQNESNYFGKTGFLLFDDVVDETSAAALQAFNMTYRADLGSIETGVAAAYFLNTNQKNFDTAGSEGLSYSMWGGLPYSSVVSFMGGFQAGVNWANANLKDKQIPQSGTEETKPYMEVKQLFGNSDFTGGFGPGDGRDVQEDIIRKRADLVMPVAGPQVFEAERLIREGQIPSLLIGVDSAIETDPRINNVSNPNLIGTSDKLVVFSSLKDLAKSGEIALKLVNNGNRPPEGVVVDNVITNDDYKGYLVEVPNPKKPTENIWVGGLGVSAVGTPINKTVGVSEPGKIYAKDALKVVDLTEAEAPWNMPYFSDWKNMTYTQENGNLMYYGDRVPGGDLVGGVDQGVFNAFGLRLSPTPNVAGRSFDQVLDLKGFIKDGVQGDSNKVKVALSSATSILLDASFSQSCYLGLANFMFHMNINVPFPPGQSPPSKEE